MRRQNKKCKGPGGERTTCNPSAPGDVGTTNGQEEACHWGGQAHPWQLIWKLPSRADEGSVVAPTFVCQDLVHPCRQGLASSGGVCAKQSCGACGPQRQSQRLVKARLLPEPSPVGRHQLPSRSGDASSR